MINFLRFVGSVFDDDEYNLMSLNEDSFPHTTPIKKGPHRLSRKEFLKLKGELYA